MQYNTSLLYRTTANMYIVYTCIYTQEFTHYLYIHLKYITVHLTLSDTTVQLYNTIAVPYLYLKTVYILGKQHTVHIRLTVCCTRMKIQMHSTLLYAVRALR